MIDHRNRVVHLTLGGGKARAMLCDSTLMAQAARDTHNASNTVSAAMGRMLSATAMMGAGLKSEEESLSVTLRGNGPAGPMTAVYRDRNLKITILHPQVEPPLTPDGHLNVAGALGHEGRLMVVRDLGFGEPYVGQVNLASGEVGDDFAMYYAVSEQTPALCALGVNIGESGVVCSGGVLVQALPGCPEQVISQLELRSPLFGDISKVMMTESLESIAASYFDGLEPVILQETPLTFVCDCTRVRIEKALLAMGEEELRDMIQTMGGAELTCHFCNKTYDFTGEDLAALIEEGKRQKD